MYIRSEKAKRLAKVARLYYEQNKTQAEIAREIGVSRPLVSRMLEEARRAGIVEIRVYAPDGAPNILMNQLRNVYGLRGGTLVAEGESSAALDKRLAQAAIECIITLGGGRLGMGWGRIIGLVADILSQAPPRRNTLSDVSPLVGNSGVTIRDYQSNLNVEIVASQRLARAHYLYTPAFAKTHEEMEQLMRTEQYRQVTREWDKLDIALVDISQHPSTPDLGTSARFGDMLDRENAVGRMIAYYYNEEGAILHSETDYAIQIPLPQLAKCRAVLGVCNADAGRAALAGALHTGLFTHLVAREGLVREILNKR